MVRLPVGPIVLRTLVGALCVSAAVASLAILLRRVASGALGMAPLVGLVGVSDFYVPLLSVVLIGQLLYTALGPPLRRVAATAPRPVIEAPTARERLATELQGVAERLEGLDAGPQVQAECARLRRIARSAAG